MKRREVIAALAWVAAWPAGARAQQPTIPVIGFLNASAPRVLRQPHASFREGLKESGYIEGQNVAIEHRFAEGQFDRMPAMAADLVRRQVTVLIAVSNAGALAAKQATAAIPII